MNHDEITKAMTAQGPYGTGVAPNPYAHQQKEWQRRRDCVGARRLITEKIESLFEPRFITPPETSELIEAIVTASDSRTILELGTHTGFTTLHILRAIYGKPGAIVVSVDARPSHDRSFWADPMFAPYIRHVEGWTPDILTTLRGTVFDLIFVDSDHTLDHSKKEYESLKEITKPGSIFLWHDMPEWQSMDNRTKPPVRLWLEEMVRAGEMTGVIIPTAEQLDCVDAFGIGYPKELNPHLAVTIRA